MYASLQHSNFTLDPSRSIHKSLPFRLHQVGLSRCLRLIVDLQKKEEDKDKMDDDITMDIIRQVSEQVDPMIKWTTDIPSSHEDKKVAVLDLKVNMNEVMVNRIDYEFFEKPNKNPTILMAKSAINSSSKRTILTQECLRRIRNTKIELGDGIRNEHLSKFMIKMKNSGYNQNYRMQILKSAFNAFEKMVADDKSGVKPLFRNRSWNKENRMQAKEAKKKHWYKNIQNSETNYKTILFVPPTPGSILLKELRQREEELNKNNEERIKIVEK